MATSVEQQKLVSSFVEIAVGQTTDTAEVFLKATSWNLEEAITLFFVQNQNSSLQDLSYSYQEEQVRPPLPTTTSTLYDSSVLSQTCVKVCPHEIWDHTTDSDSKRLSSLYRPPLNLLFSGSFENAKSTSSKENRWLLVNLQSTTEFASHALNRDVWSDVVVSQAIRSSFTLLQVYHHTQPGQKISTYYKIDTVPPVVLLIDPITGQKMRTWSGITEAQSFVEDLMEFTDVGPHQHTGPRKSNKRIRTEMITCSSRNKRIKTEMNTCSSSSHRNQDMPINPSTSHTDQFLAPSRGHGTMTLPKPEQATCVSVSNNLLKFPGLTQEPKGDCDPSLVCSICIRFPDGQRKQRRFLKSEPIQLLWSFCYSHMKESEEKAFKLVHAIPGASKTLDYGATTTFEQSGLANSMISVTWE